MATTSPPGSDPPPKKRSRRAHSLNILITPAEHAVLQYLAHAQKMSMAQILRRSISITNLMYTDGVAVCANGQRCFVPHMHPPTPDPAEQLPLDIDPRPTA